MPALYIHVPFCARKCNYCDFASFSGREGIWDGYFKALTAELRRWTDLLGGDFSTAFIGGGTPSLVPERYISDIARIVRSGEFTIEANPGTLTPPKLDSYLESGINRISIGAQSFDDSILKTLGRIHTSAQIFDAVKMARAAGFENINLDLMYALPGQTVDMWRDTLNAAISLNVEHVSAYSLIIEEGTPFFNTVKPMDDDTVNAMQRLAGDMLVSGGLRRYEISNYAKPGRECAHNICYWTRGEYIGIGSAAHSLYEGRRFHNPSSPEEYIAGAGHIDDGELTREEIIEETLMLGLRMTRGVALSALPDIIKARRIAEAGLAEISGDRFFLTPRGMELQDAIVLELLD